MQTEPKETSPKRKLKAERTSTMLNTLAEDLDDYSKRVAAIVQQHRAEIAEREADNKRLRIVLQLRARVMDHLANSYIEDSPDRTLLLRLGYLREKKAKAD
jgi:hypothetical protein